MMQVAFFCAKYKIRDNMIMTNSVFYNIVSVLAFFIMTWCTYYYTFASISTYYEKGFPYYQQLVKSYVFLTLSMGSFLNCCSCIIQTHNYVQFVMRIQVIYTALEINKLFKRMVFPNWVYILVLPFHHTFWVVFFIYVIDFVSLKWGLG